MLIDERSSILVEKWQTTRVVKRHTTSVDKWQTTRVDKQQTTYAGKWQTIFLYNYKKIANL